MKSVDMRYQWFAVSQTRSAVQVHFAPGEDRFWGPELLGDAPLPKFQEGDVVTLSGPGAVWMYAHAAAKAAADGAVQIHAESVAPDGTSEDLSGSSIRLSIDPMQSNRGLISIQLSASLALSPKAIESMMFTVITQLESLRPTDICLTGQGPVAVYARLAFHAVRCGAKSLSCFSPRAGCIQIASLASQLPPVGAVLELDSWLRLALGNPFQGKIIGVAGDPNTGKSVFSSVLDFHRQALGLTGWRLDCDAQAPTPPWYLRSVAAGDGNHAAQLRKSLKRDWTHNMEIALAEQLRSMQRALPLTVADLPGGDHRVDPPQRIPLGREVVFEPIESLILIQPARKPTANLWCEELSQHNLADRVVAILTSADPDLAPQLCGGWQGSLWIGQVRGLDRSRTIEELHTAFLPKLHELWNAILIAQESSGS